YLVEALQPQRSLSYSPIFQVLFALQNLPEQQYQDNGDLSVVPIDFNVDVAKYDLTLSLEESANGTLSGFFEYNTDLLSEDTIRRIFDHYEILLLQVIAQPQAKISQIALCDDCEKSRLLTDWNNTFRAFPEERCLHELFEQQVIDTPDNLAVEFGQQTLTYWQLNQRANQLAHLLIKRGVKPDCLVGIFIHRSVEMIIGVLAVIKAGGAYVPIDPQQPAQRVQLILDDAVATVVLSQSELAGQLAADNYQVIFLDTDSDLLGNQSIISGQSVENIAKERIGLRADNLAYLIYTSGSTGRPKGVMIEHRSWVNLALAQRRQLSVDRFSRGLQFASLSFDAAASEIAMMLISGAGLVLITESQKYSPTALSQLIEDKQISHATFPPALLSNLSREKCQSIKNMIVAGEPIAPVDALLWSKRRKLFNGYGPTETTVCATMGLLENPDSAQQAVRHYKPVIGKPLDNVKVYVLDKYRHLVPVGVPGQLYIAGQGLARGYLNRPDLNKQKFVANPFSESTTEKMYATGDWVRWLPDGNLEFIGREDNQVKIRGFRIELGEIESLLRELPSIKQCAAIVHHRQPDEKCIVAYVVFTQGKISSKENGDRIEDGDYSSVEGLSDYLRKKLPGYMQPAAFIELNALPISANGKLDQKTLPEPSREAFTANEYISPQTETEKALAVIWSELLMLKERRISVNDNFFALGGHSLLVIRIIDELDRRDVHCDVRMVFSNPTLADLAVAIDTKQADDCEASVVPANLIAQTCEHIEPDMLSLVQLTDEDIKRIAAVIPGGMENIEDIYPLAPLQEGMLFHHQLGTIHDPYVSQMWFSVTVREQIETFIKALQRVIDRHTVLRTGFVSDGISTPVQVVQRQAQLHVREVSRHFGVDAQVQIQQRLNEPQLMNLQQAPLMHLDVINDDANGCCYALLTLHHLIIDHMGMEIVLEEMAAFARGQSEQLPQPCPFREFVFQALNQNKTSDARNYFNNQLQDICQPTAPFNLLNVYGDGRSIQEFRKTLANELSGELRLIARELKVSAAILFHSAWALVLSTCSNRDDVVFGTVMSGRMRGKHRGKRMLGLFINTLPVRVRLQGKSVRQLLRDMETTLADLLAFEQTPLSLAQSCSSVSVGTPLFSALLNYRHSPPIDAVRGSEAFGILSVGGQERSNYPFNISINDFGESFSVDALIDVSIGAERVIGYLELALTGMVAALKSAIDVPALSVNILPKDEEHELLYEWGNRAHWRFSGNDRTRPSAAKNSYLLDAQQRLVPIGVLGELYTSDPVINPVLAPLKTSTLKASMRAVVKTFRSHEPIKLYRTGVLARWLPGSELELVGCSHFFRERECKKITALLADSELVNDVAVILGNDSLQQPIAYIVPTTEYTSVPDQLGKQLRYHLRQQSYRYHLPCRITLLERLPLTKAGTLDLDALPAADNTPEEDYTEPQTTTEKCLADWWAELLSVERCEVGRDANFFALGGHSLLATRLVNRIKQHLGRDLPLRHLFEQPVLQHLAATLDQWQPSTESLPLVPVAHTTAPPLSFAQQRLWFLWRLEGDNAHYNIPLALHLRGRLDRAALLASLRAIIARHEVLRTHFEPQEGQVCQVITPADEFRVIERTLEGQETLRTVCEAEAGQGFDLGTGPLCRMQLLRLGDEEHALLITLHHSVADGWSISVLQSELFRLYGAFVEQRPSPLSPLPIQYADFAHWQRQWLSEQVLTQQREYWQRQLSGLAPLLSLPTDYPRPQENRYRGAHVKIAFSCDLLQGLQRLSREQDVTLYMTLLSAFSLLLSRYSHSEDIAVGSPVANRTHVGTEALIGFFVNTLVMRTDVGGDPSFVELLARVKETALGAYAHQDIPFEYLVEALQPQRSLSYSPIFQVLFALQNLPEQQY
ncbi:MAG: amino acid adenylation domain-containing protein, partial [Exilibacterium sp.]